MKLLAFTALLALLIPAAAAHAADYNGHTVDGDAFDATATSSDTGKAYDVQVEFDADEATITFSNGGTRTITLDSEEIDDPHDISGTDSDGVSWDLDVDGMDE